MKRTYFLPLLCFMAFAFVPALHAQPELKQAGNTTQLFVKGEPVLMLGVETTNKLMDKPEDLQYLDENLDMYKAAGVNTLVQPFAWYTLEPEQGTFDYTMIDAFIEACRDRNMMLIPLWFGSIKNAQLSYAPDWVRENDDKF
ncbi:MAG: beta-galactosidase, partial [Bacteroidota bacterium]